MLFPRLREIWRNRRDAGFPLVTAGAAVAREALLGGASSGPDALPNWPGLLAKFSKLWMGVWPLLIGWLDGKFGWNLTGWLGDDGGEIIWYALSLWLFYRTPMRTGNG